METFWLLDMAVVGKEMPCPGDAAEATTSTDIQWWDQPSRSSNGSSWSPRISWSVCVNCLLPIRNFYNNLVQYLPLYNKKKHLYAKHCICKSYILRFLKIWGNGNKAECKFDIFHSALFHCVVFKMYWLISGVTKHCIKVHYTRHQSFCRV